MADKLFDTVVAELNARGVDYKIARKLARSIGVDRMVEVLKKNRDELSAMAIECELYAKAKKCELEDTEAYQKAKNDLTMMRQGLTAALKPHKDTRATCMQLIETWK